MIIENNGRKIIIGKNVSEEPSAASTQEIEDPREILHTICKTVEEGGYSAVSQLVGYIISEDPTHISNYKNARTLISRIDRDELLEDMVRTYIERLNMDFDSEDGCENED